MKEYTIKSGKTGKILYTGQYTSIQSCVESAISKHIPLDHADLRHLDLSNLSLDNAHLKAVDFSHSNLTGANLSETILEHCTFVNADLYNTCLAYAHLLSCHLENASFGATDIFGSVLIDCIFSNLSCFHLNFKSTQKIQNCHFLSSKHLKIPLSSAPVVIHGLSINPLIVMNGQIWCGHDLITGKDWAAPMACRQVS